MEHGITFPPRDSHPLDAFQLLSMTSRCSMRKSCPAIAVALLFALSGCSEMRKNETRFEMPAPGLAAASEPHSSTSGANAFASKCPGKDFTSFLQAFASDERIRDRFTAPVVLVTDWRNVDEPSDGTKTVPVARADYRDFTLRFENGAFHDIAADGSIDPRPQEVKVVPQGNGYDVSYIYGMSEGNSWRFVAKEGCWILSADPEPSSI